MKELIERSKKPVFYIDSLLRIILLPVLGWGFIQYLDARDSFHTMNIKVEQIQEVRTKIPAIEVKIEQIQTQWSILKEIEDDISDLKVDSRLNTKTIDKVISRFFRLENRKLRKLQKQTDKKPDKQIVKPPPKKPKKPTIPAGVVEGMKKWEEVQSLDKYIQQQTYKHKK